MTRSKEQEWRAEWVKPPISRRKGWFEQTFYGGPGDFEDEVDFRRVLSRRKFLRVVRNALPLIFVGGSAAVLTRDAQNAERERQKRLSVIWAPRVSELLLETLRSERLGNLEFLNDYTAREVVQTVSARQTELASTDRETRNRARWEIAKSLLTVQYQTQVHNYDTIKDRRSFQSYFSFLDRTAGTIVPSLMSRFSPEQQANMWVEAHARAFAAVNDCEPALKDGVCFPADQSFWGHIFARKYMWVPLQSHP